MKACIARTCHAAFQTREGTSNVYRLTTTWISPILTVPLASRWKGMTPDRLIPFHAASQLEVAVMVYSPCLLYPVCLPQATGVWGPIERGSNRCPMPHVMAAEPSPRLHVMSFRRAVMLTVYPRSDAESEIGPVCSGPLSQPIATLAGPLHQASSGWW